jgi:serine protease Do
MTHRILICLAMFTLVAAVYAAEVPYDKPGESWNWGYGVEEGGGGSSYLGVDIADVTSDRLSALKLKEEHGAEITMVDQDAPAGKAGLKEHDVILSLNGASIESAAQLRRMIRETPAGRVVMLGISRDGQPQTIKVQLANRAKSMAHFAGPRDINIQIPPLPAMPDIDIPVSIVVARSSLRSGLMVENLTPQLGEFFGVKEGRGVLIRSVEKGSRSEKAGFRAGDVIVRVNNQVVRDTSDFSRALRETSGGTASVTVIRDKKEQNLNLTLPSRKDSGLLLEESFEFPELSEEAAMQLSRAGQELARMAPALEKLQQKNGECWKKAQEKMKDAQRKMEDAQRKMQQKTEKLRHEFSGEWTEI